jgi:hypothetical protein
VREGSPQPTLTAANQEWAVDFAHDAMASSRAIRALAVVDECTREPFHRVRMSYDPSCGSGGQVTIDPMKFFLDRTGPGDAASTICDVLDSC